MMVINNAHKKNQYLLKYIHHVRSINESQIMHSFYFIGFCFELFA